MNGNEFRWRPPSFLLIPLLICGIFIFFLDVFQWSRYTVSTTMLQFPPRPRFLADQTNLDGFLIKTDGCRIPDMDPYHVLIKKYIFKEKPIKCNKGKPALIDSNVTSIYLLNNSLSAYGVLDLNYLKCCYTPFRRQTPEKKESDVKVIFNKECVEFDQEAKINDEFVRVTCIYDNRTIYKDFFSFAPVKAQIKKRAKPAAPLNILVIGIDAVSRLNLHRQMPNTVKILKSLGAVELLGYNKVADNTFPNLIPVLTGLTEKQLIKSCWHTKKTRFDNCPFIWKKFSNMGYSTAFAEDSSWMGIFNYLKLGFKKQPTDYYWGHFNYISEKQIGNEHDLNVYHCVGARMVHATLLDFAQKYVISMNSHNIPYFSFFWSASISHDYLNKPKLGDNDFTNFFVKLNYTDNLKNTALIVMSDHGIRWGDIRTTYQGRVEERLPFLFLVLPKYYRDTRRQAYNNLMKNARKLTTPFDLHETLKNLADPSYDAAESEKKTEGRKRRGYSLLESIPSQRTCEDAEIASHWCTCQQSNSVDKNDSVVQQATNFTVNHINRQLEGFRDCEQLSLAEIYNAREHSFLDHILVGNEYIRDYTIAFRTTPGDAIFEVTVRQHVNTKTSNYTFSVTGSISRINLYGKQSVCVTDFHLKLYCYCKI